MPSESLSEFYSRHIHTVCDEELRVAGYPFVKFNWFHRYEELCAWLEDNFGDDFVFGMDGVWLSTEADAVKFKMYWC